MIRFFLYLTLFIASIVPFFITPSVALDSKKWNRNENYLPVLQEVKTIDAALRVIENVYNTSASAARQFDTARFVNCANAFVKEKFFHGYAQYSVNQNWILVLLGKTWFHFSGVVNPNELMTYSEGLCSQQTLVFMELLKRKGIASRSVGLGYSQGPGHFLCEVRLNNRWHLYDVTCEPKWEKTQFPHESMAFYLQHRNELENVYAHHYKKEMIAKLLERVEYGATNQMPAQRMQMLHTLATFLVVLIPILLLSQCVRNFKPIGQRLKKLTVVASEEELTCVESPVL